MKECITHHNACDCREAKFAETENEVARMDALAAEYQGMFAEATEQCDRYRAALEFYASNWRCDIYVGPTEELIKDSGELARRTLADAEKATFSEVKVAKDAFKHEDSIISVAEKVMEKHKGTLKKLAEGEE